MKARLISAILLTSMTASLIACGGSSSGSEATSGETTAPAETEPVDTRFVADSLPELDFKGATVKFAVTNENLPEFEAEEANGEIVNDSIFNANADVMERLNVKIEYVPYNLPSWSERAVYLKAVEQSILTNDQAFDMLVSTQYISYFMANGYLKNLAKMPHIDLTKPWWSKGMTEQVRYNGVIPFITGDLSLGVTKYTMCMFFNKQIAEEYKLGDLYELAYSGGWTLDKLREFTSAVYADLNGNTQVDKDDRLGLVFQGGNQYMGFLDSLNMEAVDRSGDELKFVFDGEKNVNAIQKLVDIVKSTPGIIEHGSDNMIKEESLFMQGNTLFTGGWIMCAENYRNLGFEYGILPYPKYDDAQKDYGCTFLTNYSNFAVPVTNTDKLELGCATLEALASAYYRTVTPAYFETALKVKYSNDNDMSKMFDLLRDSAGFNFAQTYSNALDYLADTIKVSMRSKNPDWVSTMATKKSVAEEKIAQISDAYAEMAK